MAKKQKLVVATPHGVFTRTTHIAYTYIGVQKFEGSEKPNAAGAMWSDREQAWYGAKWSRSAKGASTGPSLYYGEKPVGPVLVYALGEGVQSPVVAGKPLTKAEKLDMMKNSNNPDARMAAMAIEEQEAKKAQDDERDPVTEAKLLGVSIRDLTARARTQMDKGDYRGAADTLEEIKVAAEKAGVAVTTAVQKAPAKHKAVPKWEVTRDHLDGKDVKVQSRGFEPDAGDEWTEFRLYDDDGELYYSGRQNQHGDGFEPLDQYGMPNAGCTEIRLHENGEWKTL